jgi:hypothetical protein
MNKPAGLITALALGSLFSSSCFAQTAAAPDDETDWSVETPRKVPPGATIPTSPEENFGSPERIQFTEGMRRNVLDQLCRNAQIPIGGNFNMGNVGSLGGQVMRRLRVMPDNHVAIEDQDTVNLSLGHNLLTAAEGAATFGLWVGGSFQGSSLVIRPMPTTDSCDEVLRLLKATDAKTVFPFKPERLTNMGLGELWKIPAVLTIGHAESVAEPISHGSYGSAVVSFGIGQTGSAMMTVFRMAPDKIRFRFRISHARIHNKSGTVVATYPAATLFAAPANILVKAVDNALASQISNYLTATFSLIFQSTDGQQLLMEFILDPNKPEDMQELASVLHGDFDVLLRMAQRMINLRVTPEKAQKDFAALEAEQQAALKRKANYAAIDVYHTATRSLHLLFPLLFDHTSGSDRGDDRIVSLDDQGGEVHLYHANSNSNAGFINIPVKGLLIKHNEQESAQAFVFKDKDGKTSDPQAVYLKQEGFLRDNSEDVRRMASDVNSVLSLAGARGGAPNTRTTIPVDKILPPEPPEVVHETRGQTTTTTPTYHDGNLALTVALNEKAVASILSATGDLIVRCYANTLDGTDKAIMNWVLQNGKMDRKGVLSVDENAVSRQFFHGDPREERQQMDWVRRLCQTAADIVTDISTVRKAPTPEARAQALVKVMAGKGESGVAYDDIMKVLVQMADPMDITADLVINVNKEIKGDPNLHTHMALKKDRPENEGLRQAGNAKNRFAQPSELVD